MSQLTPGERARAERQLRGRADGFREPLDVAAEHPEVRQQVVAEVDRLRPLEMRVARHRPVGVALREVRERAHQLAQAPPRTLGLLAHEQRHVRRHLVVARPRGVELASYRPGDLGQPALDRHVDVLVPRVEGKRPGLELGGDRVEAAQQLVGLGRLEDAGLGQHRHVRLGLAHVVGRQAPVEADRGVQCMEYRIGRLTKAGHAGSLRAAARELPIVRDRPDLHDSIAPSR